MTLIISKSLVALVISAAGLLLYNQWPLVGIIVSYAGVFVSFGVTVKRNLFSTRLIFYGVLAVNGLLFYQVSGNALFILLPLILGFPIMPNEMTFRITGSGFKGVNYGVYAGSVAGIVLAAVVWSQFNNMFWITLPWYILSVFATLGTYIGDKMVTSNRKASWNIKIGEAVPDFTSTKRGGKGEFKLSQERGRYVLINFIRGDWCPICQVHMQIYRKESDRLKENNVKLLVVSRQSGLAAQKFAEQVGLEFDLLEDTDLELADLFGAIDQKTKKDGKAIPLPVSFLIGPEGNLEYSSKPDDLQTFLDPNEVLEKVRSTLATVEQ